MSDFKVDVLVAKYVKLRDFEAKVKAELSEKTAMIKTEMDKIELLLMEFLNDTGQESANTKEGTFYKRTATKTSVADRDMFMQFVFDTEAKNFLESRVNKTAVEEYIAEHGTVPPGVSVTRVVSITVNRPTAR